MQQTARPRKEIHQSALDFLTRQSGFGRAMIVEVEAGSMKPAAAVGLEPDQAWDKVDTGLLDQVVANRQPAAAEGRVCVPVTGAGGQLAFLLYAEGATGQPTEVLRKVTDFARTFSRELEASMEAPPEDGSLPAGSLVAGRYRVEKQLMLCRFSTLYRAHDRANGIPLVLRHLEDPKQSREARLQTLREGRTLHRLRHRNLPRVLDLVEDRGHIHVVLEDIAGRTVEEMVRSEGPLHEELVHRYLKQILSVLGYLHHQSPPIVHRDLRPDTVLVSRHGVLKIAEFGLAKLQVGEAAPGLGQTAFRSHGHPRYASPEQLLGDQSHPRNDLYAAGALLYYMATGSAPTEALQRYTAGADLPTIASLRPGFPADLEATIMRLMAVDPAQRPQSVEEVLPVEEARPAEPEELRL
ncbi:MAG: serine/threonine-protein kinase, partial [Candidatus Eremiobacterota bacterium]